MDAEDRVSTWGMVLRLIGGWGTADPRRGLLMLLVRGRKKVQTEAACCCCASMNAVPSVVARHHLGQAGPGAPPQTFGEFLLVQKSLWLLLVTAEWRGLLELPEL